MMRYSSHDHGSDAEITYKDTLDSTSPEEERHPMANSSKTSRRHKCFSMGLCVSVLLNMFFAINFARHVLDTSPVEESKFAGLSRDVQKGWDPYSPYGVGNENETDRSIMWEQLDGSPGLVSLDNAWARAKGLPESQPFPWDKSRGLYLLNGHHSLHCMRKIRRWVTIAYHNGTQLDSYSHLVHCMDHLLQNILCEADDTPMYTTQTKSKDAGLRQTRACRSWGNLNKWARVQTSCYGFVNETQGVETTFERYKWCPKDSAYAEKMREHWGYPGDWFEERPAEIDSMPHYWERFENNAFIFHEQTDI